MSTRRDPWGDLFPINEAQRATQFLVDTWRDITSKSPQHFARTRREHELTEHFWVYLDRLAISNGKLMGQWSYEQYRFEFDEVTGKKIKRIRQDIVYFSNAGEVRLNLIYEFKKLKAKSASWRLYHGVEGMQRFVDGRYAIAQPLAAMVAMTLDDTDQCVDGLCRSLLVDATRNSLKMLPDGDGRYIRNPSLAFAGAAAFDTEHQRPPDQAPPEGVTTLAHIFLPLPAETV